MKDKLKQALAAVQAYGSSEYASDGGDAIIGNYEKALDTLRELIDAPEPPQREPLSNERIRELWEESYYPFDVIRAHRFARAIERELGVK